MQSNSLVHERNGDVVQKTAHVRAHEEDRRMSVPHVQDVRNLGTDHDFNRAIMSPGSPT